MFLFFLLEILYVGNLDELCYWRWKDQYYIRKSYKSNTSFDYFYIRNSFFLQNDFEQAIRESFQNFANCPTWDFVLP